ncbi:Inner membrane protein YbaN [Bremerella volcania]|uniref:Inner membrane protein YbaN n=1 Tax=Bremerella volcania TaxID=2527984 RepID=A0A518CG35_9BACT|nr:YbaN family protein [Bremerella volcania]QDU78181.1 Inner membrane protein YbaN [Bremerella volcania]
MTHPPVPEIPWTKRLFYLGCAAIFFTLAVLGMILPIVPATPFLLVTSYFLVRSFPKLNDLLLDLPYFGPILYDWEVRKGIKTSTKIQAIATVVLGWGISILLFPIPGWALFIMAALVAVGIYVIYRVPEPHDVAITKPKSESDVAPEKTKDASAVHAPHELERKPREWDRNQRQTHGENH